MPCCFSCLTNVPSTSGVARICLVVGHKMGALARAKILKPRPFPVKIYVFRVCTRALHDQSRCRSAKDQYASEEAHAITTTRLPVVIVYVRQSIIWQGTWWFTV